MKVTNVLIHSCSDSSASSETETQSLYYLLLNKKRSFKRATIHVSHHPIYAFC